MMRLSSQKYHANKEKADEKRGPDYNHPKIDIFIDGEYYRSTNWSQSCTFAICVYHTKHPEIALNRIKACRAIQ